MAGDRVELDMTQVKALADDLGGVGARLRPVMKATISKGALNVKNAAKQAILDQTRHIFVKQYPYSITYDLTVGAGATVTAEIGPDKDLPQGALGNLLEYGAPDNNPPYPHLNPALDAEEENTVMWLAKAAEDSIFGGGG
jgi:hypothetical protein